jgi:putative nucleotidyltransferase with HDIG domain
MGLNRKNPLFNTLAVLAAALGFIALLPYPLFPKVHGALNDAAQYLRTAFPFHKAAVRKLVTEHKIVGIAIDDKALNAIKSRYPWRRSLYGELIRAMNQEGADTIVFDTIFLGATDTTEDESLRATLQQSSAKVILGAKYDIIDRQVLIHPDFADAAHSLGVIITSSDDDDKIRRLTTVFPLPNKTWYSLAVEAAAAFRGIEKEKLIAGIPLRDDRTFLVNYLVKPSDILTISAFDVLTNMQGLRQRHGKEFLKGAMAVVYADAELLHDYFETPLGRLPGGFVHINGVYNILSGSYLRSLRLGWFDVVMCALLLLSLYAVMAVILAFDLRWASVLSVCVLASCYWVHALCVWALGIHFDFGRVCISVSAFFIAGITLKTIRFIRDILRIKEKATLDPLRGVYSLRYFYYKLRLEFHNIESFIGVQPYLVFIELRPLQVSVDDFTMDKLRFLWQQVNGVLASVKGFWSIYSPDELVGCVISAPSKVGVSVRSIANSLGAVFKEAGLHVPVQIGYLKLRREYPFKETLFAMYNGLKKDPASAVVDFDAQVELVQMLRASPAGAYQEHELMETFDKDIEDKNRQLLSVIDNLIKEHAKSKEVFFQIITALVNALEARDPYTEGHSVRVCKYAVQMASRLGWNKEEVEMLSKAALLHDLGKIGIPDSILHKKDRLTDEEYDMIKKHQVIAVRILEPLKEFAALVPWILYHHERWDGKGYPHGLAGDAIPLASQIISIADVFDALITGRDYKMAYPLAEVIIELTRSKGAQFKPELVDQFIAFINEIENTLPLRPPSAEQAPQQKA